MIRKYLLILSVFLSIDNSQCMSCGEWGSLPASLKEKAKKSALVINQANTDLGVEAQSRNVMVMPLLDEREIVLFSGVSPFKQFSSVKNEKYFSFIDILIGKKNADVFFRMANTSKEIILDFQKEFRALRAYAMKAQEGIEKKFFRFYESARNKGRDVFSRA